MSFLSDLDGKLLDLTPDDPFTLRDACAGVHFFGRVGSGKTTAAEVQARAYLRGGFGGIITAAKPGEIDLWKRYCAEEGRSQSLVVFQESESFNFLSYLLAKEGADGIGAVTDCLMKVLECVKRAGGVTTKRGEEPFFEETKRMLLRNAIPPLYAANGALSVSDIVRFIESAPTTSKEAMDADWRKRSFMYQTIVAALREPKVRLPEQLLKNNVDYFTQSYVDIPEKTRGNMVITVTAALDRFRHGRLARAFGGRTTLVPEMTFQGACILLGMPSLTWNEDGVIAQQLFKYIWQRSVLARNQLPKSFRERPVFCWCDEGQETVTSYDESFLGLAREFKACPVYMTQSLPAYYSRIGGDTPREDATALVGKFGTHVYLANSCTETNEFGSRMIGKVVKRRANYNAGSSHSRNEGMSAGANESSNHSSNFGSTGSSGAQGSGHSFNSGSSNSRGAGNNWGETRGRTRSDNESRGYSEAMEFAYEAGDFARLLKTGGPANGNLVTGVWFQSGRIFKATGTNNIVARFKQR